MNYKIPIETSARHIHVSQKDFELLFGKGAQLTFQKELSQPGQYLAKERITVQGPKGHFENMAILGPFRPETQVEISVTDARKMGVPCEIRQSGDIENTPGCVLIGPTSSITIPRGVIVAKRHIHMTPRQAIKMHVKDNDVVFVITKSYERALIYGDVVVRVSKNFSLAMHVDTDESNAFANQEEPYGIIIKLHEDASYDVHTWMEELLEGINR
ncbi:MAG: phosphate propanoyltransferase [Lachnospiraceae bacterium]|nr:phosphate propanoyltransferase [Lachnospiraceae bacterium]MDD3616477.1 phosphate propanoyltransferase [Lachnospiraceae bacterium]